MAFGDPGQQQFENAIMRFRNRGIHLAVGFLMTLRTQVVGNDELNDPGGTDDTTRDHWLGLLEGCDDVRRRITFNPDSLDLKSVVAKAIDATKKIEDAKNPFGGDEIQRGSRGMVALSYDLSGAEPNIPLLSTLELTSATGIAVLGAIDGAIVAWTRLGSRFRSLRITANDSLRMYGAYQELHGIITQFCGSANRLDIAQIDATAEPRGHENAPNRRTEKADPASRVKE
jgi:hypothetical protein